MCFIYYGVLVLYIFWCYGDKMYNFQITLLCSNCLSGLRAYVVHNGTIKEHQCQYRRQHNYKPILSKRPATFVQVAGCICKGNLKTWHRY